MCERGRALHCAPLALQEFNKQTGFKLVGGYNNLLELQSGDMLSFELMGGEKEDPLRAVDDSLPSLSPHRHRHHRLCHRPASMRPTTPPHPTTPRAMPPHLNPPHTPRHPTLCIPTSQYPCTRT